MLERIRYSLQQAKRFRESLKAVKNDSLSQGIDHIENLDFTQLTKAGIGAIALDFDGVLAYHNAIMPSQNIARWLHELNKHFQGRIFILSNKPTAKRIAFFDAHFPDIEFIDAVRKKPYPDGIEKIMTRTHLPAAQIAIVDDRLLTGILAALIAGAYPVYVKKPYQDFAKHPLHESFFALLRFLEKIWVMR